LNNIGTDRSASRLLRSVVEEPLESAGMMRWLLPYADMITLLLALFVILFSISTVDRVKVQRLVHDISGGFNSDDALNTPPSGLSTNGLAVSAGSATDAAASAASVSDPAAPPQADRGVTDAELQRINAQLRTYIRNNSLESEAVTRIDRRGLVITLLADRSLYASGTADLPPQTKRLLDEIDAVFQPTASHLRVEGNTDNVPIGTAKYPTNWELSAARATGVTRYLVEARGLSPLRVSVAGYGQYRPRTPNISEADRRFNRRVDIVILNAAMSKADQSVQP
jgi:chemotaxis protein MotB